MGDNSQLKPHDFASRLTISRGFAFFMIFLSAWSFYSKLKHASSRFHVPHNLVASFEVYGKAGGLIDLLIYLFMTWLLIAFVKSAHNWIDRILFASWIGPVVVSPIKMIVPQYCFVIWWIQLFMTMVFLLASIAVFLRLSRRGSQTTPTPASS
jgi:hypothetical protein